MKKQDRNCRDEESMEIADERYRNTKEIFGRDTSLFIKNHFNLLENDERKELNQFFMKIPIDSQPNLVEVYKT